MSVIQDDPRDVLTLLNSLGFVGITAPQLKAFMKDLKMHRKIKERERQQWKDETRKKILSKQEEMLKNMLRDTLALETTPSSNSTGSNDNSEVRIQVRCVSDEESNENVENSTKHNIQSRLTNCEATVKTIRPCRQETINANLRDDIMTRRRRERSKSSERSKVAEISTDNSQFVSRGRQQKSTQHNTRTSICGGNEITNVTERPLSAPELANRPEVPKKRSKSVASDPTGLRNARSPSRSSVLSQTKSFIRPWRLQPEAQRAASARKSDPVALYQKYREQWKQISFPGEESHSRVRWAIREKMLGTDPNPRPILKNSHSLQSLKKR